MPDKTNFFLFKNVGKALKLMAVITFWVMAALSILAAFVLCIIALVDLEWNWYLMPLGVIGAPLTILLTWMSVLPLYGFGELIEKTALIERNTRNAGLAGSAPMSQTQANAVSQRVGELEQLRAKGLITEAEYLQAVNKK